MINLRDHTIHEEIHRGESTILYRGRRDADGARVVVKLLRSEHPSPHELAKLKHEHAITQSLDLEGVVQVHALEKYGNGQALVMADAGARSLDHALRAGELDLGASLRIAASIANTLGLVHQRHVIHRDIKPYNVLFDPVTQRTTLIDFGIASRLSQESQRAQSLDSLEGTLAYMSPEQTGRMNRPIDHRTDMYSLGVTLYEMLTRRLPFTSRDPLELVHSHIARMPAPPREVAPDVPEVVSEIVMKLLAKAAEDRYQTARGLEADLHECLRQWEASGEIQPFLLGRQDRAGELRVPQKLYGREAELQVLVDAEARAGEGAAELLLVKGYAGVGKSTLIHEIQRLTVHRGIQFIRGKFGQLDRNTPYAAVGQAFAELCRQILTDRPHVLASWKSKLEGAIGSNGRVLTDIVPELTLILGPQPEVPALGPTESQNRFNVVLQAFLRVFAGPGRPLIVLFDDLQWADPASLKWIHFLLTDPESAHLLVIGAYRDNEVDATHPLQHALNDLAKAGVTAGEITLAPLSLADTGQLVADTLGEAAARVEPLAALVWRKTQGNPFFLGQLLGALAHEGLLSFDARTDAWAWDTDRIEALAATDNVVDLMAAKIRRLSAPAQRLLELAACIGHEFDLNTLSILRDKAPVETAAELWEALEEGLVVPLSSEYRYLHVPAGPEEARTESSTFQVSYRFLHDRVEQAAYSLMDSARRQEVHLRLGRLLRSSRDRAGGEGNADELFDIIDHLNLGAALMTNPDERLELARANLAAGNRAKAAAAYASAAGYFEAGAAALGPGGWAAQYPLCFALHAACAECKRLGGQFDQADSLLDALLSSAQSTLDRAQVHVLRLTLYVSTSRLADALGAGRAGLSLFGIELPETMEQCLPALGAELAEVQVNLAGRPIEALIDMPRMSDPEQSAVQELLSNMLVPARFLLPPLFVIAVARGVNISLKYGLSEPSARLFMLCAFMLGTAFGRHQEAGKFGELALAVHTKHHEIDQTCALHFFYGTYIHHLKPIGIAIEHLDRAIRSGMESGDFTHASMACDSGMMLKLGQGRELAVLREENVQHLKLMQRSGVAASRAAQTIVRQVIANLEGRIRDRLSMGDDTFDEAEFVAELDRADFTTIACWYRSWKTQLSFLYEDYEGALAHSAIADKILATATGMYFVYELSFYDALARLALYPARGADEQRHYLEVIGRKQDELALRVEHCPENYRHKQLLLAAERARVEGKELEAMGLYDQALAAAQANELLRDEALVSELFAKFHLAMGRKKVARVYMSDAHHGYLRWGATAKAAALVEKYPELVQQAAAVARPGDVRTTLVRRTGVTTTTSGRAHGDVVDLIAVMQAAQAFAGELVLESLLDRLMRIVVESAGAQRGYLLFVRGEALTIEASITTDPDKVEVGLSIPAEGCDGLALHVVQYVARTAETVVLGDAARVSRFAADPYIAGKRPKSILCLALVHQGRRTGILYLENNLARDTFTSNRIELLGLLSSHAAVAVENALLYAQVQRHSATLEVEVARRTEELSAAYGRLELTIGDRARSEEDRAALQETIIRAQEARLAELSTPMIPITDRIVVMPLIGVMDARRGQQVLETALYGAKESRAKVVILDITGMKLVDAGVAGALVNAAGGLRLLGAQVVITGIRPDVALALVDLNLDIGKILTFGTLQGGIAHALRQTGDKAR